jgi:hypothetical protein
MSSVFNDDSSTNAYFYATFTTSEHTISASAVCVFYMNDIINSFNGDYSTKRGSSKPLQVPNPRPSSCPNNLTNEHLLFSRKNVLMKNDITSEAFIIESGIENSFIKIDVDFHVSNSFDELFDVLFISTDSGQLMKFVIPIDKISFTHLNNRSTEMINNYYKEKFSLVDQKRKKYVIDNLKFIKSSSTNDDKYLVLRINSNKIISLSKPVINNCYLKKNISNCNNHLNPYCVWIGGGGCKFYNISDLQSLTILYDESLLLLNSSTNDDIYNLTNTSYLNNKTNDNQNVYLISFFYIISIFVSFLCGSLLTLKLIENKKKFSFKTIIIFEPNKYTWMVSRLRDVQGSVIRIFTRFKKYCNDYYKRIRNFELFKKRNENNTDKQIAESFSSITLSDNNSDNTNPRYVYVVVENNNILTNNDNYSNRTVQSTSNEDIYLN